VIELVGGQVPSNWDGRSLGSSLAPRRDQLVLSQGAWSCQRSVRFDRWLMIKSYHDGFHAFPDVMLFDVESDPHEQHDVASKHAQVVRDATAKLDAWLDEVRRTATHESDPMQIVLDEGGPYHTRHQLPAYLKRLRSTGRTQWADVLEAKHGETRAGG
jgi:hypothetical protein